MRDRIKAALFIFLTLVCLTAAGCAKEAGDSTGGKGGRETGSVHDAAGDALESGAGDSQSGGLQNNGQGGALQGDNEAGPGSDESDQKDARESGVKPEPEGTYGNGEHGLEPDGETRISDEAKETKEPERQLQKKIVVATDLHYLARELSGNRGRSFMTMVETEDGRVLQYSWEVLDAFIEDMLAEKPDIVVLTGDLTLNGERKSHEELADKLTVLLEEDIPVIVIPGNHDINNPDARRYTTDGAQQADSITAQEFAGIYADFGYVAADSRDPYSLSYTYRLNSYYWLLMLDSCQYDPVNQVGGMIHNESYGWIEEQLDEAWDDGAQVLSFSHHNLLDQSGVSREFYDNCTIEHNEELLQTLSDGMVRLHLSGHLHLQHYKENEDYEIAEIVTGSLVMAPCQYGVMRFWDDGAIEYNAKSVNVEEWAKEHSYNNRDLSRFSAFSEDFLRKVTFRNAILDLRQHTLERRLFFSDEKMEEMARFYANLCVYYYGGRMYKIEDQMKREAAYQYWSEIDYVSDLSDFLRNILEDEAKDFSHLELPYE